jgi:sensor histidine kinase regulating citrate/malate metabolism
MAHAAADRNAERRSAHWSAGFAAKNRTGLGLANAVRLAAELGGSLSLADADAAEGACFVLRLPVPAEEGGDGSPRVRA